ncbi:MAG: 1-acyl-sn-glycerol-3-phosphate acyltransferase [Clostridia bacterium]|nr:1-acyl-sn-glycerol-3-phosphate acyltransferase [Clostridia bacterium]
MKQKNVNRLLLGFVKLTGYLPAMLFFKPRVIYVDKSVQSKTLPKPCILVSNHQSLMDFVLYLCLFVRRTIRFQMAEVLFEKSKLFARFLFALCGIYVNRNQQNMEMMATCIRILDRNGTIGVFPQGRLPVNGKPFPFKPGVIYLALQSNAPIVPIYTNGNYGLRKRATVVIGKPIYIKDWCKTQNPGEQEIKALTLQLQNEVMSMKEQVVSGD